MGDWIETYHGRRIDPLDPDPEQIALDDIAHALARQCRFTGHTRDFYSVAQHSVLVSRLLPATAALAGLMHDASEAYLSDIARPVKRQPAFAAVYAPAEDRLMACIARRFGFPWPLPYRVHAADDVVLRAEARDLMPNSRGWWRDGQALDATIEPLVPVEAERLFLARYAEVT